MRKYLSIIFSFLLLVSTCFYLYYLAPYNLDSVWNYGFGYNILHGLRPYLDFNMVITPFFPIILGAFMGVIGDNFIAYHIFVSLILLMIFLVCYKMIGYKAIFVYMVMLIYPYNGYNTFLVLLMFLLLYFLDRDNNEIIIGIIIGLMFLTKQTFIMMAIPFLYYAKRRKRMFALIMLSVFVLLLYLVSYEGLYKFIDYCFLGLFDFGSKNNVGLSYLTVVEIFICCWLLFMFIKTKDRQLIYILLFQIIDFPIVDSSHFVLGVSPVIYYLYKKVNFCGAFLISIIVFFGFLGLFVSVISPKSNQYDGIYDYGNSKFLYKRMPNYMREYFSLVKNVYKEYSGYRVFLLDSRAYMAKLELGLKISKYDLINDGNMGYGGSYKYIKEISDYCLDNNCVFVVNNEEVSKEIGQTSKEIVSYVSSHYELISSSNLNNLYVNKKR